MGRRGQTIGNREKAMIHVAKSQLGMTEDEYRALLQSVGVASSKELDTGQFDDLMERLKAAGFKPLHKSARASGMHRPPAEGKGPMLAKIGAILAEFDRPWSYADGIARQMFGIERVRWCDCRQTYKILQALVIWEKRQKAKEVQQDHGEKAVEAKTITH